MATWQFDLFLIARDEAVPEVSGDGLETPGLPLQLAIEIQQALMQVFAPPWFMLEDWLVFGAEQGTRADLLFLDDDTMEVKLRLDASIDNGPVVGMACELARRLDCRLFDPGARCCIAPQPERVSQAIASSRAARFVSNPRGFLAQLSASRQAGQ